MAEIEHPGAIPPAMARIYDLAFSTEEETAQQMAAIRSLFEGRVPAGARLLDLCAGTGRISLPLAQAGYRVDARDASPAMLDVLQERAVSMGLSGRIATETGQADEVGAAEVFDAALCLDSFFYFAGEGEPESVLDAVCSALKPGGLFLFDTYNYFLGSVADEDRTASLEVDGVHLFVTGRPMPLRHDNVVVYTNHIEIAGDDGDEKYDVTASYRHFTPLELKSYCLSAGFAEVMQTPGFGPLAGGPPDDGILVTVAVK